MLVRIAGLMALAILIGSAGSANADPIRIDQSAVDIGPPGSGGSGVVINSCCPIAAQVFTAGLTAPLVALGVDVHATQTGFPLRLAITPLAGPFGSVPDLSQVLAEVMIPSGSSPLDDMVFLSQPFQQQEGTSYAIVASYPTAPPSPFFGGLGNGIWDRTRLDTYSRGYLMSLHQEGFWILQLGGDARFRTFVSDPVPEPATLLLLGSGLACAALKGRRRITRRR